MDTYRIEPENKRCVAEVYTFTHPDHTHTEEVIEFYRWGEWEITPANAEEFEKLLNCRFNEDGEEFRPEDFENHEMVEMFDLDYIEGDEDELYDNGWTCVNSNPVITGRITLELIH